MTGVSGAARRCLADLRPRHHAKPRGAPSFAKMATVAFAQQPPATVSAKRRD
ncbi:hypothetical protein M407DRAFT_245807 [Tulasnella calospora MUT 4182]|uniref:Uncharacterized protein n=1 Tax=Tulasnella calospora MUT 4182 TaxID=1051891 RepID=A0A0C3Q865_9AGAM|nr:hypothetical protein M407DRAFT_245807 [Tulasnella calospora MUT 4182]